MRSVGFSHPSGDMAKVSAAGLFTGKFFCPIPFTHIRFNWLNYADTAAGIVAAGYKPTAIAGAETMASPTDFTVGGVAAAGMTVPAATGAADGTGLKQNPGILSSDIMPCQSTPRTDAGTWFGVQVRTENTAATWGYMGGSYYAGGYLDTVVGDEHQSVWTGGATYAGGSSQTPVPHVITTCGFIEFFTDRKVISVLHFGDSLCKGEVGSSNGRLAPLEIVRNYQPLVLPAVFGRGGKNSTYFQSLGASLLGTLKPSHVVIPMWSPNESITTWPTTFAKALQNVELAQSKGIVPIVHTPYPCNYSGASLTAWIALRQAVRNFVIGTPGVLLWDIAAKLEDPLNPGQFLATDIDDTIQYLHPNVTGYTKAASVFPVLS